MFIFTDEYSVPANKHTLVQYSMMNLAEMLLIVDKYHVCSEACFNSSEQILIVFVLVLFIPFACNDTALLLALDHSEVCTSTDENAA